MCKKLVFLAVLVLFSAGGCRSADAGKPAEIVVFAASSLTNAFTEIGTAYEAQNEGVVVIFNFAGSSQLAAQLIEGVPADVFASANPLQVVNIVDAGRIDNQAVALFAANRLAVITPADNPVGIGALEDLARPGIKLVLATPGVPVRDYVDAIVAGLGPDFGAAFYSNLVSEEENVRQVVAKVALGEADAGIVYTTDVTPDLAAQIRVVPIPPEQNVEAAYPIAPLLDAAHLDLAQAFIDFVRGPDGQAILARWGFEPPAGEWASP